MTLKDKYGKTFDVACDNVIVSIGYNPQPVAPASRHVHLVGDANGVGNLRTVLWAPGMCA